MQKIDEGAEVCPGETPADAVYLLKKSVHFDNLNVIRRESDTEQQFLKQLHKSLHGSQERRRHAHQRRNKYLVCFKMSRKAAPAQLNTAPFSNFGAEQCTCGHLCQKHYTKDAAKSSSFEFAKVNAAATATANTNGFRSNILKIFRQFNLKNQCCCQ